MRHGAHPLLNMAAAGAVVTKDPAGNRKLDKSKTSSKIDPIVAAVMSVGAFMIEEQELDVASWIG
jgi:phage terminase large subunit-like protein